MTVGETVFGEAARQLVVCNSCRYCEGYCAVFPALERRVNFTEADVLHLANLCHDCRACLYACPYSPPHEFAVNPPRILAEVRRASYDGLTPQPYRAIVHRRGGVAVAATIVLGIVVVLAATTVGLSRVVASPHGTASPYGVISYRALLIVAAVPLLVSIGAMARGVQRYWALTHGALRDLFDLSALTRAVAYAGSLRYLRGGGGECFYPDEAPTPARRRLHALVAYGFSLCLISTISAAVLQDLASSPPPYGLVSVPVLTGLVGGIGLVVGCAGLIALKGRSDPLPTDEEMAVRDYGLLLALLLLGASGLLVLLTRTTAAYPIVLLVHLVTVVTSFALVPATKFVHIPYRFLAIVQDNLESPAADRSGESH